MDTKLAVAKLDEHNFLEWRRDMRWYLIAKKLWDPESEGEVEASLDLQSLAQIGLHLTSDFKSVIEECKTARAAWAALEATQMGKSKAQVQFLHQQFSHLRRNQGETLAGFVARVKGLRQQLRSAGETVSEAVTTRTVLGGLPAEFATIVAVLNNMPGELELNDVVARLLQDEQMRVQPESSGQQAGQALYSRGRGQSRESSGLSRKGNGQHASSSTTRVCWFCGIPGHIERGCPAKARGEQRRSSHDTNPPKRVSMGHFNVAMSAVSGRSRPLDNWGRAATGFRAMRQPSSVLQTGSDAQQQRSMALSASGSCGQQQREWVLDTGATQHVTFEHSRLQDEQPAAGQSLTFGNGAEVKAISMGTVPVQVSAVATFTLSNVLFVPSAAANLFSVPQAVDGGVHFDFGKTACTMSVRGAVVAVAPRRTNGLYCLCEAVAAPAMFCGSSDTESYASLAKPVSVGAGSGAQAEAYCSYAAVVRKPQKLVRPLRAAVETAAQLGAARGIRPPGRAEKSGQAGRPDGPAKAPQQAAEGQAACGNMPFGAPCHQSPGGAASGGRPAGQLATTSTVGAASGKRPARQLSGGSKGGQQLGASKPQQQPLRGASMPPQQDVQPGAGQLEQLPMGAETPKLKIEDKTDAAKPRVTWASVGAVASWTPWEHESGS